ncbi:MAG: hypothetical protein U0599_24915 [Vicinamibacteria bacterium]
MREGETQVDLVVEAYKKDVDRTLLRENLRKTPDERVRDLVRLLAFADELRRAGREATGR